MFMRKKKLNYNENKKKLANLLLKNYILLYFIMTGILFLSLIIATLIGTALYFNLQDSILDDPSSIMRDDYTNINSEKIESLGGYLEVIDNTGEVIFRKGSPAMKIDKYDLKSFNEIINNSLELPYPSYDSENSSYNYIYRTVYNEEKDFLLIIAIPRDSAESFRMNHRKLSPKYFIMLAVFIALFILLLGFIVYSRISSKNFVRPLKLLIDGSNKISKGDYSARIYLKSKTEFGELRDVFNSMAEKLENEKMLKEKSEELRRRLILDISHDLKNPLSIVLGYSDYLIKNESISESESKRYLNVINQNALRANNLLTELFEFSKLQSVDFKLKTEHLDICEFLRELIASYIPKMEEKNFQYDFDIPEKTIIAAFDKNHLDRALSNIIMNSIKYNPNYTHFIMTLSTISKDIIITIEDNGIGIPTHLQKDIFNPFVRVDASRNHKSGGTGLGLAISKSLIEMHNGSINLESDLNKGTKFTIILNNSLIS
ncbi:HAMP domain-containing sensor histidine kinase [Clostridium algidicarnis]|uniref:HAMP domain-containing sensor histidine kinase n=1 Tax=Clostridium algidicarnis TaxID=37659 RepID=UPI001C0E56C4|nr:HAMP domain-containing sensor histidine kinase [Clostridium algidicarnis]MBU3208087.1 HAMP domain-containing histidine kinase [Clostridium algidicarnis]MBU3227682.1 HAMP domain-containing histidine kinase [Clostridium algidicarnis]MBU3250911.1 HAMP domain-containing histidine kinase [Clostridium algidicarnis]